MFCMTDSISDDILCYIKTDHAILVVLYKKLIVLKVKVPLVAVKKAVQRHAVVLKPNLESELS